MGNIKWTKKADGSLVAKNFTIRPIARNMRLIEHVRIVKTHKDKKKQEVETVEEFDLQTDFGGFQPMERAKKLVKDKVEAARRAKKLARKAAKKLANRNRTKEKSDESE